LRKQHSSTRQATALEPSLAPEQLPDQHQACASFGEAFRAPSQNSPANIILEREKQVSPVGDSPRHGPSRIDAAKANNFHLNA
jgi:hypothetical protein